MEYHNWTSEAATDRSSESEAVSFYANVTETALWLPSNVSEEAKNYLTYRIGVAIHIYYTPILVPVGLVFNLMTLTIMLQRSNRRISCCVYLAALSVTDNLVLYSAGHYWASSVLFHKMSYYTCRVIAAFFQMFSVASTFLTMAVTADRYLATCYPIQTLGSRTSRRAVFMSIIVTVLSVVANIPMVITAGKVNEYTCATFETRDMAGQIIAIIAALLFVIVPFCMILTLNIAIFRNFSKRRRSRPYNYTLDAGSIQSQDPGTETSPPRTTDPDLVPEDPSYPHEQGLSASLSSASDPSDSAYPDDTPNIPQETEEAVDPSGTNCNSTAARTTRALAAAIRRLRPRSRSTSDHRALEKQLSQMLLTVSFMFLILTLPQYVRYVTYTFVDFRQSAQSYATYILIFNITNKLYITKSAINFILYCISGGRFRRQLKRLCQSRRCCISTDVAEGGILRQSI